VSGAVDDVAGVMDGAVGVVDDVAGVMNQTLLLGLTTYPEKKAADIRDIMQVCLTGGLTVCLQIKIQRAASACTRRHQAFALDPCPDGLLVA